MDSSDFCSSYYRSLKTNAILVQLEIKKQNITALPRVLIESTLCNRGITSKYLT